MKWALFLDDERDPDMSVDHDGYRSEVGLKPLGETPKRTWLVARSVEEALALIAEHGIPGHVTFDHDLGDGVPTGCDLAKRLVDMDLDGEAMIPENFSYEVHSANPIGRANIHGLLDNYLDIRQRTPSP